MADRLLHMIWLGESMPAWVRASVDRWSAVLPSGMRLHLWTDQDAPLLDQIRAQWPHLSLRAQADLVRIVAVHTHGGVYVDVDTVPLRPYRLMRDDSWIGAKPEGEGRTLINAHFGMQAEHPMLARLLERAREAIERGATNDHFIAGPRTWRKVYEELPESERPVLLPRFPTLTSGPLTRLLPACENIDQTALAEEYPDATLLHVIYNRRYER